MPVMFKALPVDTTTIGGQNTYVVDLAGVGDLHTLFLRLEATNRTTAPANAPVFVPVTSIQIAGPGTTSYFSMTPLRYLKVHYYRTGAFPEWKYDGRPGATQYVVLPIYFGRDLIDPNFFLPTGKFKDLKCYITVPDPTNGGFFQSGSFRVIAWGLTSLDGAAGPYAGTIIYKEQGTKTTDGVGEEVFSVPKNIRIARLYLDVWHNTLDLQGVIGALKLDIDRGRIRFSDVDALTVERSYSSQFPWEREFTFFVGAANGDTINTYLGNILSAAAQNLQPEDPAGDTIYTAKVTAINGQQLTLGVWSGDWTGTAFDVVADTTARPILISLKLAGLPNIAVFDFVPLGWDVLFFYPQAERIELVAEDKAANGVLTMITESVEAVG